MPAAITGLRETVRNLEQLGVDVDDLKEAFGQIATLGADEAAKLAPSRTGRLRASIRGNRAKNKAVVTAGRATVRYAGPINYGWPERHIKPAGFMQEADRIVTPKAIELLEDGLAKAIEKNGLT